MKTEHSKLCSDVGNITPDLVETIKTEIKYEPIVEEFIVPTCGLEDTNDSVIVKIEPEDLAFKLENDNNIQDLVQVIKTEVKNELNPEESSTTDHLTEDIHNSNNIVKEEPDDSELKTESTTFTHELVKNIKHETDNEPNAETIPCTDSFLEENNNPDCTLEEARSRRISRNTTKKRSRSQVLKCTAKDEGLLCQCLHCVKVWNPTEKSVSTTKKKRDFRYPCQHCKRGFQYKSEYEVHKVVHSGVKPFHCDICLAAFTQKFSLDCHKREQHSKNVRPRLPCHLCSNEYLEKETLLRHLRKIHYQSDPDNFHIIRRKCEYCDKTFATKTTLNNHTKLKHLKDEEYMCFHCNSTFYIKKSLITHMKQKHIKNEISCKLCDFKTTIPQRLSRHHAREHKGKSFSCEICGKTFAFEKNLKNHRVTHFDDKPWVCKTCGKGFKRELNLKQHQTTHSDSRPHSCSICNETFKLKTHVKQHMAVHGLLLTHKCNLCNNKFARKTELKQHLARVHSA